MKVSVDMGLTSIEAAGPELGGRLLKFPLNLLGEFPSGG